MLKTTEYKEIIPNDELLESVLSRIEIDNPSNIIMDTNKTIETEIKLPEQKVIYLINDSITLKDLTGMTIGSNTFSVNDKVLNLINDNNSNDSVVLKLTLDPNLLLHEDMQYIGLQGETHLSVGISENNFIELIPSYVVSTTAENIISEKYIKIQKDSTLYIQISSPAFGGWITPDGSLNIGGSIGSLTKIDGYDSNPPEEGSTLFKYIVCVYTTFDPLLDESTISIDYDFTK